MSIYSTILSLDGHDHEAGCTAYLERAGVFERTGHPCDCRGRFQRPIVYQGFHILPSMDDLRDGFLDLASIPGFIEREGRDDGPDDEDDCWPFLRVAIGAESGRLSPLSDGATLHGTTFVLLDRALVSQMYDVLGDWLERTAYDLELEELDPDGDVIDPYGGLSDWVSRLEPLEGSRVTITTTLLDDAGQPVGKPHVVNGSLKQRPVTNHRGRERLRLLIGTRWQRLLRRLRGRS